MNKFEYKNLTPFKWFVLENFPFIEADFDALTEWQLFCKLGKEINKIIDSQNLVGEQAETLTKAFNELKNYVDNYFKNLDVQNEIDNKLNKMASDGTLDTIINQNIFSELNNEINSINAKLKAKQDNSSIFIGDSYATGTTTNEEGTTLHIESWCEKLKRKMSLSDNEFFKFAENGAGFYANGVEGHNFLELLKNNINQIPDKSLIKNIFVCGGFNDRYTSYTNIEKFINNFVTYAKQQFPNAKIYVGMIGACSILNTTGTGYRRNLYLNAYRAYKNCISYGAIYLNGVEYALKNYSLLSYDGYHPNTNGYETIANFIYQAYINGSVSYYSGIEGASSDTEPNIKMNFLRNGDITTIELLGSVHWDTPVSTNVIIDLGSFQSNLFRLVFDFIPNMIVNYHFITSDNKYYYGTGNLEFKSDNSLALHNSIITEIGNKPTAYILNVTDLVIDKCVVNVPTYAT